MLKRNTLSANGVLVSYLFSEGSNPVPIIFLHGWRSKAATWKGVLEALSKNSFSTYAFDLPGFGLSGGNPSLAFSVEDYAKTVAECLKKLSLEKVILVGHSFGGRVGIVLAAEYPNLISKLILVDSAGIRETSAGRTALQTGAKLLRPFFSIGFMRPLRRYLYILIGAEDYLETPELHETFKRVIAEDLTPFLPRIGQETLLIWGENDTDTPLSYAHIMKERIPHVKLLVLEGAGHFSFLDAPETFLSALSSFAKNTPSTQ